MKFAFKLLLPLPKILRREHVASLVLAVAVISKQSHGKRHLGRRLPFLRCKKPSQLISAVSSQLNSSCQKERDAGKEKAVQKIRHFQILEMLLFPQEVGTEVGQE